MEITSPQPRLEWPWCCSQCPSGRAQGSVSSQCLSPDSHQAGRSSQGTAGDRDITGWLGRGSGPGALSALSKSTSSRVTSSTHTLQVQSESPNEPQPKPTWHTQYTWHSQSHSAAGRTYPPPAWHFKPCFMQERLSGGASALHIPTPDTGEDCPLMAPARWRAWRCCALEGKFKLFLFRRIVGLAQP